MQNLVARLAINSATPALERAFVELLLYQGARLNLVIAAWRNEREVVSTGIRMADIDRIAIGMVTKGLAPEIISKLHVVASRDLVEVVRVQRSGRVANHLDAAARKECS